MHDRAVCARIALTCPPVVRSRPHRTCSVERVILHYDGAARETLTAALGGGG